MTEKLGKSRPSELVLNIFPNIIVRILLVGRKRADDFRLENIGWRQIQAARIQDMKIRKADSWSDAATMTR